METSQTNKLNLNLSFNLQIVPQGRHDNHVLVFNFININQICIELAFLGWYLSPKIPKQDFNNYRPFPFFTVPTGTEFLLPGSNLRCCGFVHSPNYSGA